MKASENETVADIVSEMRRDAIAANAWCETHGEMASAASVLNRHADRIEAAHRREVAELLGERNGILKANESLATDNTRLRGELSELRECLKEAVNNECNYCRTVRKDGTYGKCEHLKEDGECDHLRGVKCIVHKWRKALKGAEDEH